MKERILQTKKHEEILEQSDIQALVMFINQMERNLAAFKNSLYDGLISTNENLNNHFENWEIDWKGIGI